MKRFKKIVIIMITACLLLGVKTNDSKQVEETAVEQVEVFLCEWLAESNVELL